MLHSLRAKLLLSHLALIVLAMGLAGLLLLTFLQRYFLQAAEESLIAQARITAQALIPGAQAGGPLVAAQAPLLNTLQQRQTSNIAVQTNNQAVISGTLPVGDLDLSYLENTTLQLGAQLETRIRLLDVAGAVRLDSRAGGMGLLPAEEALILEASAGRYASRVDDSASERALAVALPVTVDGSLVGVMLLTQPLRDIDTVLGDLRLRWAWSTAIALLLSGAVGLLLSGAITRPVQRLTTAAASVAQGRLDAQVPVRSRDELGRLSSAFNDMTARLQAARRMQTDFVANVSHELRTPLTAIKGMVETLRGGAVDDIEVRDRFLATVETETDRLIRLVNDLLLLSRADSAALNLRCEPLDLVELARELIIQFTPQARSRELQLVLAPTAEVPLAWADRDRIAQVLVNLLDNALRASQPGGTVTLSVRADAEGGALLEVRDQGVGIPAEALSRLGERFYRVDRARSREGGAGSGLGLSIARALVEAHGGTLTLASQLGAGATATVTLPPSL